MTVDRRVAVPVTGSGHDAGVKDQRVAAGKASECSTVSWLLAPGEAC